MNVDNYKFFPTKVYYFYFLWYYIPNKCMIKLYYYAIVLNYELNYLKLGGDKMKVYTALLRVGIILCIAGILLTVINYFTGFINSTMTTGASIVCLSLFIIVLIILINDSNRKKNK